MSETDVASARTPEVVALVGLVLLASAVRLPGLGYGLWIDEVATVLGFVRLPMVEMLSSYPSPNHHVLNSALARVSVLVFGETPWAVRLPAYAFGVATVPVLYILVRLALTRAEATGAAFVLAVSYHHAYFSQNARGYTGYVFFTILGTFFLLRALQANRRRHWTGYAIAGAANVYVLLSGLFAVASQSLGALVLHVLPEKPTVRRARLFRLAKWTGIAAVLTLLLYAPLLEELVHFYSTAEGAVGWSWSNGLLGVLLEAAIPTENPWLIGALILFGVPVGVAGSLRLARRLPLVFFAFLLPPLMELAVGASLGAGSYPRRFILLVPFGVLLGVCGAWSIAEWIERLDGRRRVAMPIFALGVAVGSAAVALPLPRLYSTPKQDFRGALEWVALHETDDDAVVAAWVAGPPSRYVREDVTVARTRAELASILQQGRRVWLLTTLQQDMERFEPGLADLVRKRFQLRERFPGLVGGGAVVVWESRPDMP